MRTSLLATGLFLAIGGAAMAQSTTIPAGSTAATGPTNGAAQPMVSGGVQSSNGSGIGANGGIKSGTGLAETTPSTGMSSTPTVGGGPTSSLTNPRTDGGGAQGASSSK